MMVGSAGRWAHVSPRDMRDFVRWRTDGHGLDAYTPSIGLEIQDKSVWMLTCTCRDWARVTPYSPRPRKWQRLIRAAA